MYKSILIMATAAMAFAVVYGLINSEPNSFNSGFAGGVGALLVFDLWLEK